MATNKPIIVGVQTDLEDTMSIAITHTIDVLQNLAVSSQKSVAQTPGTQRRLANRFG